MRKITIAWRVSSSPSYWATIADGLGAQLYIAFIAVIGVASAIVAYRHHLRLAQIGGAALLLGVAVGRARLTAGDDLVLDGSRYYVVFPHWRHTVLYSDGDLPILRRTGGIRLPVRFARS